MRELSREILADYQVRKGRAQKTAFRARVRAALEAEGYAVAEEKSPTIGSVNMVVGDVARAEVIFTAHYDTCAALPVPNFLAPKNLVASLAYQVLLAVAMIGFAGGVGWVAGLVLGDGAVRAARLAALLVLLWLLLFGPANRHTANDNTSGVLVLLETMLSLPPQARGRAAFVFFDNEEIGLLGSSFFAKKHGRRIAGTPLINFDCVSDGDHFLFVTGKGYGRSAGRMAAMEASLALPEGKTGEFCPSGRALYPSDQMHFPCGIGVVALRRRLGVGYYVGRIHTRRDTVMDAVNIETMRAFAVRVARGEVM